MVALGYYRHTAMLAADCALLGAVLGFNAFRTPNLAAARCYKDGLSSAFFAGVSHDSEA
jgi:hypothetical protein